jgi:hypothetical protein
MPVNIKTQKDVLVTEVTLEPNTDLNSVDQLMRSSKATGRIVAVYNQGGRQGVNVEQRSRVSETVSDDIRRMVGIGTRELDSI